MNPRERGFLLLSSHLGDPDRKPLTAPQLRLLAERMQSAERPETDRELTQRDIMALGYRADFADHVVKLLADEQLLDYFVNQGIKADCFAITRVGEGYPLILRKRLGLDSPGCLWARGDVSLLSEPTVSLVGSRELNEENYRFAAEVGRQAALQGYTLVSGNARGADKTAQESCLAAGGKVISVVADELCKHPIRKNVLYLSEDGYNEPFSAQRAISRNRVIHALGLKTFVAQSSLKTGGTWDGTVKNLRHHWSDVYCFDDGSESMELLSRMGARLIGMKDLNSFYDLEEPEENFLTADS